MTGALFFFLYGLHAGYISPNTPDIKSGLMEHFYEYETHASEKALQYLKKFPEEGAQYNITLVRDAQNFDLVSKHLVEAYASYKPETTDAERINETEALMFVVGAYIRGGSSQKPYRFDFINDRFKIEFLEKIFKRFKCREIDIERTNPGRIPTNHRITFDQCPDFERRLNALIESPTINEAE